MDILDELIQLIEKAKSEKSAIFEKNDLISMLEKIQVFSNKTKRLLTEAKGV